MDLISDLRTTAEVGQSNPFFFGAVMEKSVMEKSVIESYTQEG
jgi:hypothetical protein